MIETFEPGDTRQFTFVSSIAPNAAPILKMMGIAGTVISSITGVQSDSTHYYAMFTMPTSTGMYIGEWFAQKTVSGSAYNFIKRFVFRIEETKIP